MGVRELDLGNGEKGGSSPAVIHISPGRYLWGYLVMGRRTKLGKLIINGSGKSSGGRFCIS